MDNLAPREEQALRLIAAGNSQKEAARVMGCSAANVRQCLAGCYYKLNVNRAPAAVAKAVRHGLILLLVTQCLGTTPNPQPWTAPKSRTRIVRRVPHKTEIHHAITARYA